MTREQMIETIKHELIRQDEVFRNGCSAPGFNVGALADAIGVRAGLCTVTRTLEERAKEVVTWNG